MRRSPAWDGRKKGTQNQAIGRSRGGLTTKIVALVDGLGNLARFVLLPGQRHDSAGVCYPRPKSVRPVYRPALQGVCPRTDSDHLAKPSVICMSLRLTNMGG